MARKPPDRMMAREQRAWSDETAAWRQGRAVEKGYLPLTATVADVDQNGNVATANVTATLPNGVTRTMPLSFVQGPSPTGWQLSQSSLWTLAGMLG